MCSESIFEIDEFGNKIWRNKEGEFHRLDGPAIEGVDGRKEWYQNGELHRLDGPAQEFSCGDKYWYKHGERHRLDGPAAELYYGEKIWIKNNIFYKNKNSFFESMTEKEKEMVLFSEDFLNG
jgi:hypothetical protein